MLTATSDTVWNRVVRVDEKEQADCVCSPTHSDHNSIVAGGLEPHTGDEVCRYLPSLGETDVRISGNLGHE